jgi:histone-lysine N-methyltransferase SETDB1
VLTEQEANKDGKQYGDEYLFDLDLIETCGNTKEGYESDAASISSRGSDDSELQTDFPGKKSLLKIFSILFLNNIFVLSK